ncbi:MAG: cell division protein FtsQ/DivIB, partial [Gammaproteobacteria bacterium]|nr:cell division protein FtsQ/DivIB [Gammaproteobacteria bacterium]
MGAKRSNRRKAAPKQKFTLPSINVLPVLKGMAACVVLAGVYQGTIWLLDQPIEAVRIHGTFQRVPSIRVEAALDDFLDEGFLSLNLNQVRARLAEIPWVANASVRRQWPGVLDVTVIEEQAAARWGKNGLLNTRGELFVEDATHLPAELPHLNGPEGAERQVAQRYFELEQRVEQRGLSITVLSLDKRGSWTMRLSSGIDVRLGSAGIEDRAERFFRALDQVITEQSGKVAYIDMRYTNGFAIGWKKAGARNASIDSEIG